MLALANHIGLSIWLNVCEHYTQNCEFGIYKAADSNDSCTGPARVDSHWMKRFTGWLIQLLTPFDTLHLNGPWS